MTIHTWSRSLNASLARIARKVALIHTLTFIFCSFSAFACEFVSYEYTSVYNSVRGRNIDVVIYYSADEDGKDKDLAGTYARSIKPYTVFAFAADSNAKGDWYKQLSRFTLTLAGQNVLWISPLLSCPNDTNANEAASDLQACLDYVASENQQIHSKWYGHIGNHCILSGHGYGASAALLCAAAGKYSTAFALESVAALSPSETSPSAIDACRSISAPTYFLLADTTCDSFRLKHVHELYEALLKRCKWIQTCAGQGHCGFADKELKCTSNSIDCDRLERYYFQERFTYYLVQVIRRLTPAPGPGVIKSGIVAIRESDIGVKGRRFCVGDTITLSSLSTAPNILWLPDSVTTREYRYVARKPGEQRITLQSNECLESNAQSIVLSFGIPEKPTLFVRDQAKCAEDSILARLSVRNPNHSHVRWSTGQTTDSIDARVEGKYKVELFDPVTCSWGSESCIVDRPIQPSFKLNLLDYVQICRGSGDVVRVNAEYCDSKALVVWSDGFIGPVYTITRPGIIHLSALALHTDDCCRATSDTLIQEIADVVVDPPRVERVANTLSCLDGDLFTWYRNGDSIANENTNSLLIKEPGRYQVKARYYSRRGCGAMSAVIDVIDIVSVSSENGISLVQYREGELMLRIESGITVFTLWNVRGQVEWQQHVSSQTQAVDLSHLPKGVYVLQSDKNSRSWLIRVD